MDHDECGNLFGAGRSLLESSGLVRFRGDSFACNSDEEGFEEWWKERFDPDFGRYMVQVWVSVGAENLNQSQGGNYILQRWQRQGRCKNQCIGSSL